MAEPHSSDPSPQRFTRGQPASELLRDVSFPLAVRGYDRRAVDDFVDELRSLVDHLEARQTREGVVQKALDELGEETAGILQRAHETADEIAARSRAQADGRLQRAEREAELVRREADEYADQVVTDTRLLWDERQRLLEDIRQLADEVLGTADDAQERLKLPEPLAAAEADSEPLAPSEADSGPLAAADEDPAADEDLAPTPSDGRRTPIPHPLSLARDDTGERRLDPSIPYDLESPDDERDPDATVAWSVESEEDETDPHATGHEPDAIASWAGESDEEEEPETTASWADRSGDDDAGHDEDPGGEEDPDATVLWTNESGDEPEDDGPGTVELEALPGGNSEDQGAEGDRRRERD
jgi:DivIVA domain-containing protein